MASNKELIWERLKTFGLTDAGAAGLMGNLQAESGLIPNRLEILCIKRYRENLHVTYTDESYTKGVDTGTISRSEFLSPMGKQYGYGLAQWTSPNRKAGLYDLCKSKGVSIGDLDTQIEWLITELKTSYKQVYSVLTSTNNIRTASDIVLTKFEVPANAASMKEVRSNYSYAIYNSMAKKKSETKPATSAPVKSSGVTAETILNIMRSWLGYSEANGKYKKIIDTYNSYPKPGRGYKVQYSDQWCDTTVSAAFVKAGAVDLIGGIECGVEEHVKLFKKAGIWIEDGAITPKPGYLIVYNWNDKTQPNDGYADHIGIVESVSGTSITTIEGNYKDSVGRRTIAVGNGYIRGYATPKYANSQTTSNVQKNSASKANNSGPNKTPKWVGEVANTSLLNVRKWAGIEYDKLGSWPVLKKHNLVDVCDTIKDKNGEDWYYVRIGTYIYGFVMAKYIQKV